MFLLYNVNLECGFIRWQVARVRYSTCSDSQIKGDKIPLFERLAQGVCGVALSSCKAGVVLPFLLVVEEVVVLAYHPINEIRGRASGSTLRVMTSFCRRRRLTLSKTDKELIQPVFEMCPFGHNAIMIEFRAR